MSLVLITGPATAVLSVDDAKAHLRVLSDDEDEVIEALIDTALGYLDGRDGVLGRALITQTWDLYLDEFPSCDGQKIEIPLPPLQSIVHVKYVDADGALQTLDNAKYTTDIAAQPGFLYPVYGESWPSTRAQTNAVQIRFTCGYGDEASDVPKGAIHAMKLLVSHWFENREPVNIGNITTDLSMTVDALLAPLRVKRF